MIVLKDFKYLCFLVIILISTENFSQSNDDYYVHKNSTFGNIEDKQTNEIFRLKELLKMNANYTSASNQEIKKMDSLIVTWSPDNESFEKFTFEYNDKNQLTTHYIYDLRYGELNLKGRTNYTYGDLDKIIKRTTDWLIEDNWQNDYQEIFEYDITGNEIFHLTQGWENSNWVNWFRTFSNYDSLNNFIGGLNFTWKDSLWEFSLKSELKYNINNQVDEVIIYDFDGHWKKLYLTKCYYDENNELDFRISQKWNGSYWSNSIKLYYDTLKNGQIVNENIDVWYNNQWFKSSRIVYHYDKDKSFLHAHCEYWQGDRWLPNIDLIHVQNVDGFEIHYITHQVDIYYEQPTSVEEENPLVVKDFVLEQNYPNPFNPSTTIKYKIPSSSVILSGAKNLQDFSSRSSNTAAPQTRLTAVRNDNFNVRLTVYDVLGREIATLVNKQQKPGNYEVQFDATELTSGIYFYKLKAGTFSKVKKMILTK
jgi:hypothetical protein